MAVLRLPAVIPVHFVASVHQYHRACMFLVSSIQPIACRRLTRLARCSRPAPRRLTHAGSFHDGTARASQVPGESSRAFALLSRPRPRPTAWPYRQPGVAPASQTTKAATISISGLVHTASALAVYASRFGFPTLARLASGGWHALTGWDSNPLDSSGEFQLALHRPSIPTPQA